MQSKIMKWKREKPIEEGWYWAYDIERDVMEIANIIGCGDDHFLGCEHSFDCNIGDAVLFGDKVLFPNRPEKEERER